LRFSGQIAGIGGFGGGIHAAVMTSCFSPDPVHHPVRRSALNAALLLTLVAGPGLALAQKPTTLAHTTADRHYGLVIDRYLWLNPVAHGYQHGYEDGFHSGEWAHQMYTHPPAIDKQADWKHADRGYELAMGNREEFRRGYRMGYRQGYEDAYSGHSFQALRGLQQQVPSLACLAGCPAPLVAARRKAPR